MDKTTTSDTTPLAEIIQRLGIIESKLGLIQRNETDINESDENIYFCALPEISERTFGPDISPNRAFLIHAIGKKWVSGTTLHYYFFKDGSWAGDRAQQDVVRRGFELWKNAEIGVSFVEVDSLSEAEIRIGFLRGDGSWSFVGRDILDIPKQNERTMNFGWDLTRYPGGVDTAAHEIGHTLGFFHEHQNPFSGIVWNEEAVYSYFSKAPNWWQPETIKGNILRKLSTNEVEGTHWDPNSIMHYAIDAGLIVAPERYQGGIHPHGGLSEGDIKNVRHIYPQINDAKNTKLEPFRLEELSLAPTEQKNFLLEPQSTRHYTIQTFGGSDTVMVLFEEVNGELRYVAGDDDSGNNRNAKLCVKLYQGKHYVLRIRLYLTYADGTTGVMMW